MQRGFRYRDTQISRNKSSSIDTVPTMSELIVFDGDFEAQLRRHLPMTGELGPGFAMQALKHNRFAVYKTHLDYLRAGAQVIRTNTRRISINSLEEYLGLTPDQYISTIQGAVRLAHQAIFRYYEETGGDSSNIKLFHIKRPLVAGTCSSFNISCSSNKINKKKFILTLEYLVRFHKMRIDALVSADIDMLIFESIATLMEIKAIISALVVYPYIHVIITFLCPQEGVLQDGCAFAEAVTYCQDSLTNQIIAIGIDSSDFNLAKTLLQDANNIRRSDKIPSVFFVDQHFLSIADTDERIMVQHNRVQECLNIGVRFIGGTSNTNVEDVKKIIEYIESYHVFTNINASFNACSYQKIENAKNQSKL